MSFQHMLPNELIFSKDVNCLLHIYYICKFFRNQSYQARIQLSVLDYNAHINRDKAKNKEGDTIYARKFRKQTKKWDASATWRKKISIYSESYETKSQNGVCPLVY